MNLREIVSNFLDSSDSSSHSFRRLYNMGAFGMRTEFNLDMIGSFKTVLLTLHPNKTASLPCDYVRYNKIGITNMQGELVTLKINNQLTNYHQQYFNTIDRTNGVPKLPTFGVSDGLNPTFFDYNSNFYYNYNYNSTTFQLFGIGSGTQSLGEYKVDEQARIILFDPYFQYDQVLLEYLSDGCDEDNDDYDVDIRAAEAMKCYIRWQNAIDKPKQFGIGQVQIYKREFYNQKRLAKCRLNPVIINELADAERRSWRLTAKA